MMNADDAEAFFNEFLARIPSRIHALERNVRTTVGFEGWQANFSELSIVALTRWYEVVGQLDSLDHSEHHTGTHRHASLPKPIDDLLSDQDRADRSNKAFRDLTIESSSIAVDIAIYVAESVRNAFPSMRWMRSDRYEFLDSNHPILEEHKNEGFAPILSGCLTALAMLRFPDNEVCFSKMRVALMYGADATEQYRQSRLDKERRKDSRKRR